MSQFHSFSAGLMVRDGHDCYLPVSVEQVLETPRWAIALKMQRGTSSVLQRSSRSICGSSSQASSMRSSRFCCWTRVIG